MERKQPYPSSVSGIADPRVAEVLTALEARIVALEDKDNPEPKVETGPTSGVVPPFAEPKAKAKAK